MADIFSFLKTGWENIWKNKSLWGFGFLMLIEPIIHIFVPYQTSTELFSSLRSFVISLLSLYLSIWSMAGVSFISYRSAIGETVSLKAAYQSSKHIFWRVVGLMFALLLILSPFMCAVFIYSFKDPPQVTDFAHNFVVISMPLSALSAIFYFSLAEIIINDSKIGKSVKSAWIVFTRHFAVLIAIGLLLAITSYLTNIIFGAGLMVAQNNLDILSLKQFDFFSPYLSFTDNNFYTLANTILTIFWRTYITSVFTVAYLKYNGATK